MTLTKGAELTPQQRAEVLRVFVYRNTHENRQRAEPILKTCRLWVSDDEWIRDHAFYITRAGRLSNGRGHNHAEPVFLAEV